VPLHIKTQSTSILQSTHRNTLTLAVALGEGLLRHARASNAGAAHGQGKAASPAAARARGRPSQGRSHSRPRQGVREGRAGALVRQAEPGALAAKRSHATRAGAPSAVAARRSRATGQGPQRGSGRRSRSRQGARRSRSGSSIFFVVI
jgi:hypothetical protein